MPTRISMRRLSTSIYTRILPLMGIMCMITRLRFWASIPIGTAMNPCATAMRTTRMRITGMTMVSDEV